MKSLLIIGLGGFLGSIARYGISLFFSNFTNLKFPFATLITNLLGCFIIGLVWGIIQKQNSINQDLSLFLIVGVCGGFTTFSTFAHENFSMLEHGNYINSLFYSAISLIIGVLAVWGGFNLIKT